jgi:hypothetical protein
MLVVWFVVGSHFSNSNRVCHPTRLADEIYERVVVVVVMMMAVRLAVVPIIV